MVGGDAYVDHPSFGTAIISRLLEAEGYKVGVLAQPRYTDCEDFKRFGKPKYGFFIGGGNVDSMVSHYSVAKIPRAEDEYSPGGKGGARPDRSATVYTRLAKQAYPDLPVILGGLEEMCIRDRYWACRRPCAGSSRCRSALPASWRPTAASRRSGTPS